ncbi:MAG: hypothetical protein KIT09_16775 [Bryobacteraceae bacterium]|nr:hypothetical protein [Bryobacteraceae bacterium]
MEERDTDRPFSKDQERHLLRLAKKLFMEHHPNPQRLGCPDHETLKAVAHGSPDLPRARQESVMDHLSICSPCFREFYGYRRGVRFWRRVPVFVGVAALVIVASVLAYDYFGRQGALPREPQTVREEPPAPVYEQASLDLRGHSPVRGESPGIPAPEGTDLVLPRRRLALTIILPVGSEEGAYSIRLGPPGEAAAVTGSGRAEIREGTTSLDVRLDTLTLAPGEYVLGVREEPWPWTEYAVELR